MQNQNKGVPLVSFSGGLDSTSLLYNYLNESREVDIIISELSHSEEQVKREKKAIDAILKEFKKLNKIRPYNFGLIRHTNIVPCMGVTCGNAKISQGVGWIANASLFVRNDTPLVALGYVKGDTALNVFHYLKEAWTPIMKSLEGDYFEGKIPDLEAPYRYTSKTDIIKYLPPNILKLVSWCESRESDTDCGHCASCVRMLSEIAAMKELEPTYWDNCVLKTRYNKMIAKRKKKVTLDVRTKR